MLGGGCLTQKGGAQSGSSAVLVISSSILFKAEMGEDWLVDDWSIF